MPRSFLLHNIAIGALAALSSPCKKHQRCDRTQTGVSTPGPVSFTTSKPWKGDRICDLHEFNLLLGSVVLFRTFFSVASLPGVAPPSVVFRLFETLASPVCCVSSEILMYKFVESHSKRRPTLQQGTAFPTASVSQRHSKERPFPQQGNANATASVGRRHVKGLRRACVRMQTAPLYGTPT